MYSTSIQNLVTHFSRSRYMIVCVKIENGSCDLDHALLRGFVTCKLGLRMVYLFAKLMTLASTVPEIWLVPIKI